MIGIGLGLALTGFVDQGTAQEISQYLQGYLSMPQTTSLALMLLMLRLYMVPILVAFFLGFVSIGVVLLPLWTALYAGILSFCVSLFVASFGEQGLLVAGALLGIRALIGIPCYLWIALQAHDATRRLAQICLGVKKGKGLGYDSGAYWSFALCVVILLLGVCVDSFVTPKLLSLTLSSLL
ncbi:hypothetical protein RFF05_01635 [Bengtsoniella intestinalis]|uniref:hypothetical protein n=1 Tax=Bengtsoniella intestinalis TaxID=3073143 RepID=UPI00391FAF26